MDVIEVPEGIYVKKTLTCQYGKLTLVDELSSSSFLFSSNIGTAS